MKEQEYNAKASQIEAQRVARMEVVNKKIIAILSEANSEASNIVKEAEITHSRAKWALNVEYARDASDYKTGDVVTVMSGDNFKDTDCVMCKLEAIIDLYRPKNGGRLRPVFKASRINGAGATGGRFDVLESNILGQCIAKKGIFRRDVPGRLKR